MSRKTKLYQIGPWPTENWLNPRGSQGVSPPPRRRATPRVCQKTTETTKPTHPGQHKATKQRYCYNHPKQLINMILRLKHLQPGFSPQISCPFILNPASKAATPSHTTALQQPEGSGLSLSLLVTGGVYLVEFSLNFLRRKQNLHI